MALYSFGVFEFDSPTGELRKTGRLVRLRPQPARALEHLLVRHGEFVSRAELQRAIWPDGTFVHFDHGLNSCMKQIRAALGDSRSAPEYVETLVRRGFRFIAPVTVASPRKDVPELRRTRIRGLPLRPLGDAEVETACAAEGLGDEILLQRSGASPPDVAAVAAGMAGPSAEFEPEVPADYLLALAVRTAGGRLRVTSKLIDARNVRHVWVGRFDATIDEPFDAQASVAQSIVREVIAALGCDLADEVHRQAGSPRLMWPHRRPPTGRRHPDVTGVGGARS
jgi:DNA-binding winged helix-turn-helix (wHTH) protein